MQLANVEAIGDNAVRTWVLLIARLVFISVLWTVNKHNFHHQVIDMHDARWLLTRLHSKTLRTSCKQTRKSSRFILVVSSFDFEWNFFSDHIWLLRVVVVLIRLCEHTHNKTRWYCCCNVDSSSVGLVEAFSTAHQLKNRNAKCKRIKSKRQRKSHKKKITTIVCTAKYIQ